jgi:hypothetical protein
MLSAAKIWFEFGIEHCFCDAPTYLVKKLDHIVHDYAQREGMATKTKVRQFSVVMFTNAYSASFSGRVLPHAANKAAAKKIKSMMSKPFIIMLSSPIANIYFITYLISSTNVGLAKVSAVSAIAMKIFNLKSKRLKRASSKDIRASNTPRVSNAADDFRMVLTGVFV